MAIGKLPQMTGYRYSYWWSWLKGYSGEFSIGYADYAWDQYIWYDQALKTSMDTRNRTPRNQTN